MCIKFASLINLQMFVGRNAGTPLHHAAKRGLEQTVKLLLSHGGMSSYPFLFKKLFA